MSAVQIKEIESPKTRNENTKEGKKFVHFNFDDKMVCMRTRFYSYNPMVSYVMRTPKIAYMEYEYIFQCKCTYTAAIHTHFT